MVLNRLFLGLVIGMGLVAGGVKDSLGQETIRLGATIPLTGDFALSGGHIRAGIDGAVEELRLRSHPVEIHYEDSCLPAQVMAAFSRLVTVYQIDAMVSNYCVIALPAIRASVIKHAVPVIQSAVTPPEFLANNSYLYSSFSTVESEVQEVASHIYHRLNGRRVAILSLETPWGEGYANSFSATFSALGGHIVARLAQPIGQTDFRSEILKLGSASADIIFIVNFGGVGGALIQQLRRAGMSQPIVGVQDAFDTDLLATAGSAAEGFTFFMPESNEPLFPNIDPHPLAQKAYADTLRIAAGITGCHHEKSCISLKLATWRSEALATKTQYVRVVVKNKSFLKVLLADTDLAPQNGQSEAIYRARH